MIKLACGVRGCWPIIVSTTEILSTTVSTTEILSTTATTPSTIASTEENREEESSETNILAASAVILTISTLVLALLVIIITLYKKLRKSKRVNSEIILAIIKTAQQSAITMPENSSKEDMAWKQLERESLATKGGERSEPDHPDGTRTSIRTRYEANRHNVRKQPGMTENVELTFSVN